MSVKQPSALGTLCLSDSSGGRFAEQSRSVSDSSRRAIPLLHPALYTLADRARRQSAAVPPDVTHILTVGSEVGLWPPVLARLGLDRCNIHIRTLLSRHVMSAQDLITHVAAGIIDIAIMYPPQHRPASKSISYGRGACSW